MTIFRFSQNAPAPFLDDICEGRSLVVVDARAVQGIDRIGGVMKEKLHKVFPNLKLRQPGFALQWYDRVVLAQTKTEKERFNSIGVTQLGHWATLPMSR